MTTKTDIKKLLSKGLTGKEAGKLILQDNWLVDHAKEGFLSERDISALKAGLKTQQDIHDYNSYVETYKLVDFTLKEANILALEAQRDLAMSIKQLDTYILENKLRWIQIAGLPAIVTQKQYEEMRAKQRELKLKRIDGLKDILEKRADMIAPQEIQDEQFIEDEEGHIYEYLIYLLQENYPDLWKQTVSDILEVIREGRLKPVLLSDRDQAKLDKLWQEIRDTRDAEGLKAGLVQSQDLNSEYIKKLNRLRLQEDKLLKDLYLAGRSSLSQESQTKLISSLEQLLAGTLGVEEECKLLEFTLCSGEDLCQAGLPEWIREINTYTPNLDEETAARPLGMMQSFSVAIIQDPAPRDLDERGYYKDPDLLGQLSGLERKLSKGVIKDDTLEDLEKHTRKRLSYVLAMQVCIEAVSEVVGVDFTEDIKDWQKMTALILDYYNSYVDIIKELKYLGVPRLKPIKLDSLKPSQKTIKYIQERMSMSLGAGWQEAREALGQELEEKELQEAQDEQEAE